MPSDKRNSEKDNQLGLDFDTELDTRTWPDGDRFPLNISGNKTQSVEQFVINDIQESTEYLIVTGFTSLSYIVEFLKDVQPHTLRKIRIILGNEPLPQEDLNIRARSVSFSQQICDYWINRGFSIQLNGALIQILEQIKDGRIEFYQNEKLHAKIYIGDTHAILGSSNFSYSGLRKQKEANIRIPNTQKRYNEICQIALNFLESSDNVTEKIKGLLESLLKQVSWKEALGRAIKELLEGDWVNRYTSFFQNKISEKLWPSQKQAVAEALWILDNHGSVLIADPTGSGKTKIGINLLYALMNRCWKEQAWEIARAVVISPPLIQETCWKSECENSELPFLHLISSGLLSSRVSDEYKKVVNRVRDANILLIDEAHNYLNSKSARSQNIAYSTADHVILSTATPINKQLADLLRLVEILGLDNLSEQVIKVYRKFRYKKHFTEKDLDFLRDYIKNFTVRRTKVELNRLIEADPINYTSRLGTLCRYPKHWCRIYDLKEPEEDTRLAIEIDQLAQGLKGLLFLRKLQPYYRYIGQKKDDAEDLVRRLTAARALAIYNVRAMLRSSKPALIEHIEGTEKAVKEYRLGNIKIQRSGNIVGSLLKHRDYLPSISLKTTLPAWLTDLNEYQSICDQEIEIYKKIAVLVREISEKREILKARQILEVAKRHPLAVVYDSRIITLHYIKKIVDKENENLGTIIVTGSSSNVEKKRLSRVFGLGSEERQKAAFCSDAMAEGVNFQQASAVVFLDLPSVIRLAEQRVGRVDRLDSPHKEIEVFWPSDGEAFALKTDRRFIERHTLVKRVLGSNMPVPEALFNKCNDFKEEVIDANIMIEAYDEHHKRGTQWDGLKDAFKPVRDLIYDESYLITEKEYSEIKKIETQVISRVSCLRDKSAWGFFALHGDEKRAPRWIFIDDKFDIKVDIEQICDELKNRLLKSEDSKWNVAAERFLCSAIESIKSYEQDLLPNKKKRALIQMKKILKDYFESPDATSERKAIISDLFSILNSKDRNYDYFHLAQSWLNLIKPYFQKAQESSKRKKRILRIKQLNSFLQRDPLHTCDLSDILDSVQILKPLDRRITSCIIAVPDNAFN